MLILPHICTHIYTFVSTMFMPIPIFTPVLTLVFTLLVTAIVTLIHSSLSVHVFYIFDNVLEYIKEITIMQKNTMYYICKT